MDRKAFCCLSDPVILYSVCCEGITQIHMGLATVATTGSPALLRAPHLPDFDHSWECREQEASAAFLETQLTSRGRKEQTQEKLGCELEHLFPLTQGGLLSFSEYP